MIKIVLFQILFLSLLLSCKKENKNNTLIIDNFNKEILSESSETTFKMPRYGHYRTRLERDSTFICLYYGTYYDHNVKNNLLLCSDTLHNINIHKYKIVNNNATSVKRKEIIRIGERIDNSRNGIVDKRIEGKSHISLDKTSYKQVEIENKSYMYFSYTKLIKSSTAVNEHLVYFTLVDTYDLSSYQLIYLGNPSFKCEECIDGDFLENYILKKHYPLILAKLKELSKSSKKIYQRTPKDDDIYYHLNYETKWNKDNNANNIYRQGYSDIKAPIWSTYYTTNLFKLNKGSISGNTENNRYLIKTYFRGNIIGLDKNTKMYFPLFIESCILGCNKKIELFDEDSLRIKNNDDGKIEYRISMKDIIFDTKIAN